MKNLSPNTQRLLYERQYACHFDDIGIPDDKIILGSLPENKSILSIGCGTGSDIWYLAAKNNVVGVDFAVNGLLLAKNHFVQGIVSDFNSISYLPFKDKSFDIIVCKDILEHVLEPMILLQDVKRILKDDGYVVISVPNHFYLPMRWRILLGKGIVWKSFFSDHTKEFEEWNYMHIRFFTFNGFSRFLESAGFHPEHWFWDFGELAHYNNPDMWLRPQLWKWKNSLPVSRRAKVGLFIIRPLWSMFNTLFPVSLRRYIVSLAPGLLCAGFYVRVVKNEYRKG